jgi:hypothetical protein
VGFRSLEQARINPVIELLADLPPDHIASHTA